MAPENPKLDHAAWAARFGWLVGGALGLCLGFAATYALEVWVFRARLGTHAATAAASRSASVVVPALFVAGALGGHAFGARGGAARYRALGIAAGISLAALGWALLVLTR
jgi:hypothetical protein